MEKDKELSITVPEWMSGGNTPLNLVAAISILTALVRAVTPNQQLFFQGPKIYVLLFLAGVYICYRNLSQEKGDFWQLGVPFLIFFIALFSHYTVTYNGSSLARDYQFFAVTVAIFLAGYALSLNKAVKPVTAIVGALFVASLVLHLATAFSHDYLAALDPYWHFKWMQEIVEEGRIPEFEDSVYPMIGGLLKSNDTDYVNAKSARGYGLDNSNSEFFSPALYASLALALKDYGVTIHDVAMVFPAVLAGFSVVLIYLLVSELFSDMKPYNKLAGAIAAFILTFSPAFAAKAVATNAEDDALGMLLMIGGLYLFFASINRKSFKYAGLSGLALMALRMSWNGWLYALMVIGVFSTIYAAINFFYRKNTISHIPYLAVSLFISQLWPIFLHGRGVAPAYAKPPLISLLPIISAFFFSLLFQLILKYRGRTELGGPGDTIESKVQYFLEKNINVFALIMIVLGILFVNQVGLERVANYITDSLSGASERSVVHDTVAEQNPLVGGDISSDSIKAFISEGYKRYGIAIVYCIFAIPLMVYLAFEKQSKGAIFLLTWAIPMMWGVFHKSAWLFASSAAITALGSTVGLFAAVSKKDLNEWRVIGTMVLLVMPVTYLPILGFASYSRSVGHAVLYSGPSRDRSLWEPALVWHKDNTDPGQAILTWWDYGHWFTSISKRPVLIDNLQADQFEIQDVARFFVNATSEQEAFNTVKAYNEAYLRQGKSLDYVTIDWTMIGKTSALHYISLGDIEKNIKVDPMVGYRSYGQCRFSERLSTTSPKIVAKDDGTFSQVWELIFECGGIDQALAVIFTLSAQGEKPSIDDVSVLHHPSYTRIPWSQWMESKDASLLGVYDLDQILACGLLWNDEEAGLACRNLEPLHTLVYVPQEFQDYMLTRLYLGDYVESYERRGLVNRDYEPLKHFRLIKDFSQGYVRTYEISYEGFSEEEMANRSGSLSYFD